MSIVSSQKAQTNKQKLLSKNGGFKIQMLELTLLDQLKSLRTLLQGRKPDFNSRM